MKQMGGIQELLAMLPGANTKKMGDLSGSDEALKRAESIIYSMTKEERANPAIINISRKQRIAKGAGVDVAEVNRLMKQYEQGKKMMKQMSGMMSGKGRRRGGFKLPFGL